jgi:hypothetical protein
MNFQHIELLSKFPGYVGTARYELTFSRTNLESKIMKGYASEEERAMVGQAPKPPTWLALHEFDSHSIPLKEIKEKSDATEWSQRMLKDPKSVERAVYRLEHTHLKP